jgi:hypothetical protein
MKLKIAKLISIIGHPLLTIPIFVAIVMFTYEDFKKASVISFLIIGCIFVPIILRMYIKSKNQSYTNFDVSDRLQRKSLFIFALPILIIITFILFKTKQSTNLCLSVLFATILIFISQIINLYLKSSLHVSLNIYLSFLVMTVNFKIGVILFLLTGIIGWSRIVLGSHSTKEVLYGGVLGLIISLIMVYTEGYL